MATGTTRSRRIRAEQDAGMSDQTSEVYDELKKIKGAVSTVVRLLEADPDCDLQRDDISGLLGLIEDKLSAVLDGLSGSKPTLEIVS